MVLRGRWFNIITLNVHAPTEEKSDDSKDSFYEELEQVFDRFLSNSVRRFYCKIGEEEFFQTDDRE
jgi:hypothetical protein